MTDENLNDKEKSPLWTYVIEVFFCILNLYKLFCCFFLFISSFEKGYRVNYLVSQLTHQKVLNILEEPSSKRWNHTLLFGVGIFSTLADKHNLPHYQVLFHGWSSKKAKNHLQKILTKYQAEINLIVKDVTLDTIVDYLPKMTHLYKTVSSKASFNLGDFDLQTYKSLKENLGEDAGKLLDILEKGTTTLFSS